MQPQKLSKSNQNKSTGISISSIECPVWYTGLNQGVTGLLPLKDRLLSGIDQLCSRLELAATVSLLEVLARKPDAFATLEKNIVMRFIDQSTPIVEEDTHALKLLKIIWRRVCKTMHIDKIKDILKGPPRILFVAAEKGNTIFIVEFLRTYPDLMFNKNEDGHTVFHIALMHHHQGYLQLPWYEPGEFPPGCSMIQPKDYPSIA
uniref:Ankyrin repeat-containing protein n=1 Tax=Tanacetum cinerariifolium TaxID=118510 RepID=A0A6L2M049_TANCI|nr:ankyrin repeat-containing protein [Tanacetum cinerariifolium]